MAIESIRFLKKEEVGKYIIETTESVHLTPLNRKLSEYKTIVYYPVADGKSGFVVAEMTSGFNEDIALALHSTAMNFSKNLDPDLSFNP